MYVQDNLKKVIDLEFGDIQNINRIDSINTVWAGPVNIDECKWLLQKREKFHNV